MSRRVLAVLSRNWITVAPPSSAAAATLSMSRPRDHSRSVNTCSTRRDASSPGCEGSNIVDITQCSLSGREQWFPHPTQQQRLAGESERCRVHPPLERPFHPPVPAPPDQRWSPARHPARLP